MYKNGVSVGNNTAYDMPPLNAKFYLGGNNNSGGGSYKSYMDDFRIYNRALTATEIKKVYGYTLSKTTGNNIDNYSYYWNGNLTNAGDNAYITLPQATIDPIITSKKFSISYWMKYEDLSQTFSIVDMKNDTNNSYIKVTSEGSDLKVIIKDGDFTPYTTTFTNQHTLSNWSHYAITAEYNQYNYLVVDLYKNNIQQSGGSFNIPSFTFPPTTANSIIHIGNNGTTDISPNYLAEFRIFDDVLTGEDIGNLYDPPPPTITLIDDVTVNSLILDTNTYITETSNILQTQINNNSNVISERITNTSNDISYRISNTSNDISYRITNTSNEISERITNTSNDISYRISNTSNEISDRITNTSNDISYRISNTSNLISERITNNYNELSTNINNINTNINNKIDNIWENDGVNVYNLYSNIGIGTAIPSASCKLHIEDGNVLIKNQTTTGSLLVPRNITSNLDFNYWLYTKNPVAFHKAIATEVRNLVTDAVDGNFPLSTIIYFEEYFKNFIQRDPQFGYEDLYSLFCYGSSTPFRKFAVGGNFLFPIDSGLNHIIHLFDVWLGSGLNTLMYRLKIQLLNNYETGVKFILESDGNTYTSSLIQQSYIDFFNQPHHILWSLKSEGTIVNNYGYSRLFVDGIELVHWTDINAPELIDCREIWIGDSREYIKWYYNDIIVFRDEYEIINETFVKDVMTATNSLYTIPSSVLLNKTYIEDLELNANKIYFNGIQYLTNNKSNFTSTPSEGKLTVTDTETGTRRSIYVDNVKVNSTNSLENSTGNSGYIYFSNGNTATTAQVKQVSYSELTDKPTLFDGNYNNLTNKPTLFDGNYNNLTNKPDIYKISGDIATLSNLDTSNYILSVNNNLQTQINNIPTGSSLWTSNNNYISYSNVNVYSNSIKIQYSGLGWMQTLTQFPREVLSSANHTYQNGINVKSWASSYFDIFLVPYKALDRDTNTRWATASGKYVSGQAQDTTSYFSVEASPGIWYGEILGISLGETMVLKELKMRTSFSNRAPKDFKIYGSTDNNCWDFTNNILLKNHSSWVPIQEITGATGWTNTLRTFTITNTNPYKFYAILCNKVNGDIYWDLNDCEFWGNEQGNNIMTTKTVITDDVLDSSNLNTSNYVLLTSNAVSNRITGLTTTNITEGTNLYYTPVRVAAICTASNLDTSNYVSSTSNVISNRITGLTTTNITEGTNLYYTPARVANICTASNLDTSNYISTQISTKANLVHSHTISDITSLQTTLDAKQNTLTAGTNISIVNNTISSTASSQWTTSQNMIYYNTSNVGIGTTNPISLLTLGAIVVDRSTYNHSTAGLTITNQTPTSTTVLNDPKDVLHLCRQGTNNQAYGARATFQLCRYENSGYNSRTRLDISLSHASYDTVNVMSIRSDGRVGIGTTTPSYPLHITGDLNYTGTLRNNGSDILATKQNTLIAGANISIVGNTISAATGGGTSQWTSGTNLIYYNGGSVGIGTATPSHKLTVYGGNLLVQHTDTWQTVIQMNNNDNSRSIQLNCGNTGNTEIGSGSFGIYLNSAFRFVINYSNGNVGIGITNPSEKLTIHGGSVNINPNGGPSSFSLNGEGNLGRANAIQQYSTQAIAGDTVLRSGGGKNLLLQANGGNNAHIHINTSGNIGIGNTTQSYKLDVSGEVNAHGLRINGVAINNFDGNYNNLSNKPTLYNPYAIKKEYTLSIAGLGSERYSTAFFGNTDTFPNGYYSFCCVGYRTSDNAYLSYSNGHAFRDGNNINAQQTIASGMTVNTYYSGVDPYYFKFQITNDTAAAAYYRIVLQLNCLSYR